jgi:hypothetical protein
MSKTYRRKKSSWSFRDYDYTYENGFVEKQFYGHNTEKYKKEKAIFHSDAYSNYGSCVPHWYVNMFFEKPNRQKAKAEINKWMKNPQSSEVLIDIRNRGAGWNYW